MQRLKNGKRRQVPHRKRASFGGSALVVTVHQLDGLPSLRTRQVMGVFQKALAIAKDRFGCRGRKEPLPCSPSCAPSRAAWPGPSSLERRPARAGHESASACAAVPSLEPLSRR